MKPTAHTAKPASTPNTGRFAPLGHTLVLFVVLFAIAFTATPALALPPGRVYEMVSPIYKAGYGVTEDIAATAPDGEDVAFKSLGGFAGALSLNPLATDYLARRGPSGWSTTSAQPPFGGPVDFSSGLEEVLGNGTLGPNAGTESYSGTEDEFQLHRTDTPETVENWEAFGGIVLNQLNGRPLEPLEQGASGDLCHVLLAEAEALLPEAVGANSSQLYDLARGCGGEEPSLRLVGLNNKSPVNTLVNPRCPVELGLQDRTSHEQQETSFNALAAAGNEIFFTVSVETPVVDNCSAEDQLFVRLGGSRTLEVSKPLSEAAACGESVPCGEARKRASAYFEGASEDGSLVFFKTTQPLTGEGVGDDLYMAKIACPGLEESQECAPVEKDVTSLVQVSHNPASGEGAEVQGVLRAAPDGSRVYFVARGVLTEGVNAEGHAPVKDAENLYLYETSSKRTVFMADLCSGSGLSGTAADALCPRDLTEGRGARNDTALFGNPAQPEAQSDKDGRFLVFSTYGQLLPNDTDNAKDVYRYDAETGALVRLSLGEGGHDANGNRDDELGQGGESSDATITPDEAMGTHQDADVQDESRIRVISEDGSRIVFSSAEPLSPEVSNHDVQNIYEWHEGSVSLVSSGSAEESDTDAVITPSGGDIFFTTIQGLVSQDSDGLRDVYDARLAGGFPAIPSAPEECSADACQGALSTPAALLVPGSAVQTPGENVVAPVPAKGMTPKKATPKCAKGKKLSHDRCVKTQARSKRKTKAKKARDSRRARR